MVYGWGSEQFPRYNTFYELIVLGFTTRQPLWVILCRLPEKGRRVTEEIVEEMREEQGRKRNRNESEETEEIKTFPLYPYLLQG